MSEGTVMSERDENSEIPVLPSFVTQQQLIEALGPFYDLLGLRPRDYFAEPGLVIGKEGITFTLATRSVRKPDEGRMPAVRAAQIGEVVVVGAGPAAETGLEVTVAVRRP